MKWFNLGNDSSLHPVRVFSGNSRTMAVSPVSNFHPAGSSRTMTLASQGAMSGCKKITIDSTNSRAGRPRSQNRMYVVPELTSAII